MTNDEAIYVLKNTAWLGSAEQAEKVSEAVQMAIEALKTQLSKEDATFDCISRQAAIDAVRHAWAKGLEPSQYIEDLPPVQPEPLSDAYMKAVWTWLLNYQIKAAELQGRYTPYEVLSWVVNDWRKEHDGSD